MTDFVGSLFGFGPDPDFGAGQRPISGTSITSPFGRLESVNQGENINTRFVNLDRSLALPAIQSRFPRQLSDLDTLRATIRPGFSQLRQSRLNALRRTFDIQKGQARNIFARRKLGGSSFELAELSRLAREQAQAESDIEAASFLDELNANRVLMADEQRALAGQLGTEFQFFGLGAQTGAQLAASVGGQNQIAAQIAAAEGEFQAAKIAAQGEFLGTLLGSAGFGGAFGQGGAFGKPFPKAPTLTRGGTAFQF